MGGQHTLPQNNHKSELPKCKVSTFSVTACGERRATGMWAHRGQVNGRPKYTLVGDHNAVIYWHTSGEWRMYFKDRQNTPTLYRSKKLQAPIAGWEVVRGLEPAPHITTDEDEDEAAEGHKSNPFDDTTDLSAAGS